MARWLIMCMAIVASVALAGCVVSKETKSEGEARADAIAENLDEDPVEVHADLAAMAMNADLASPLQMKDLDPSSMRVVIRPSSALDDGDFVFRLWYDEAGAAFWLEESSPYARAARWYGPIAPTNEDIVDLLPEDYKTLKELEQEKNQEKGAQAGGESES